MANPWMKKNPLMSLWLSAANRVAGSVRGQVAAQARRNLKSAVASATQTPPVKGKPRSKR